MRKGIIITIAAAAVLVIAIVTMFAIRSATAPSAPPASGGSALAADSHVLDEGDAVTVVEFLDFECPACAAFVPVVEELRAEFEGRLTYAVRYYPLPKHPNAVNAAIAAEAAARQGQFEAMATLLFARQADWAGNAQSQAPLFRDYAAELGLDLAQYDTDVADPAVLERVQSDVAAGAALGVQSTPSFFVDDELLQLQAYDDLRDAVAARVG
ncbi:thioredoxin domain-containing protein [Leifsonia sp. H3M29-4]|uniref:DsbA family protein n=1 Tax=Salinibacterium metalliresistens TaxID=3031321 RepID=UPI0023DA1041|nr:thioredoxin domain-containing protein [Salinibacterium metalliresistens]MDF1478727.1 thioredoxin domain-containing protein [Salinibacterium metalliresistens]